MKEIEKGFHDSPPGALRAAREAGISIAVEERDGGAVLLLRGDTPFPDEIIAGLRKFKPQIIALIEESERQIAEEYPEAHAVLVELRERERQRQQERQHQAGEARRQAAIRTFLHSGSRRNRTLH